jgi:hypothetical protein
MRAFLEFGKHFSEMLSDFINRTKSLVSLAKIIFVEQNTICFSAQIYFSNSIPRYRWVDCILESRLLHVTVSMRSVVRDEVSESHGDTPRRNLNPISSIESPFQIH